MHGYEHTFKRFDEKAGAFQITWNWPAFVFGVFWYLFKGMWAKALIYTAACFVFGGITAGVGAAVFWVAFGTIANYDLYLKARYGTQLWEGAKFQHVASSPFPEPGSYETQLQSLRGLRDKGLMSETEYLNKRSQIIKRAENADLIAHLDESLRIGVITEEEHREKVSALLA